MHARTSITIRRPAGEIHERFKQLLQDPDVTRFGPVDILEDEPGKRLGFHSTGDATSKASGAVVYADAPGGRGTEVHLDLEYSTFGGAVGDALKKLTGGEPLQEAKDDLRRLRQIIETGEVVRSDGTPEGYSAARHLEQRPAQPLEHANA